MDFAARSAFFTAAGVEISGLGAPFGTATAVRMPATGVALLGMMLPEEIAPGKGAMMSDTSRGARLLGNRLPGSQTVHVGHFYLVICLGLEVRDDLIDRCPGGARRQESDLTLGARTDPTAKHKHESKNRCEQMPATFHKILLDEGPN